MSSLTIYAYPLTIKCLTGLHIGSGKNLGIGGADNIFIKHPITNDPYIPGSSLKGRMRFLLEKKYEAQPIGLQQIKEWFGSLDGRRPTRFLFGDANLSKDWQEKLNSIRREGEIFYENKTETKIDRNTGRVSSGSLRTTERVPSGAVFETEIRVLVLPRDDINAMEKLLKEGINLINAVYIGGSGSRGYGWVEMSLGARKTLVA